MVKFQRLVFFFYPTNLPVLSWVVSLLEKRKDPLPFNPTPSTQHTFKTFFIFDAICCRRNMSYLGLSFLTPLDKQNFEPALRLKAFVIMCVCNRETVKAQFLWLGNVRLFLCSAFPHLLFSHHTNLSSC